MAGPTRLLPVVLLSLLTLGCASPDVPLTPVPEDDFLSRFGDRSLFGPRPDIYTPDELHRLTPDQQAAFLAYFNHPSRAHIGAHERIYQYLENNTTGFHYRGATLTAAQAFATNSGNCLSLAIMTTAFAQLAGVEIGYQLMADQPVFEYQGSVIKKGLHVRSLVYNPDWNEAESDAGGPVREKGLKVDYFPELKGRFIDNLSTAEYHAMYYSNIAADAIAASEYGTAYWHLLEALRLVPDQGTSLNMLAVLHRRIGDLKTAESIYLYGIAHAQDKLSLLKNYHTLLQRSGRTADAARIQQQLDLMDDPSPFHWLQLARESQDEGEWGRAVRYYQRALTLAPYMDEAHLGLAQSYYGSGHLRSAEKALRDAIDFAGRANTRTLYEAKLAMLRREF